MPAAEPSLDSRRVVPVFVESGTDPRAFLCEVDTGSREENATNKSLEHDLDSTKNDHAQALCFVVLLIGKPLTLYPEALFVLSCF